VRCRFDNSALDAYYIRMPRRRMTTEERERHEQRLALKGDRVAKGETLILRIPRALGVWLDRQARRNLTQPSTYARRLLLAAMLADR
jgi:hypothetical protein